MNEQLLRKAQEVLRSNWTGSFTKPAPSLYPHQWNWDAGFIALGYAHFDMDKAEAELRRLFAAQWAHGMLPHIVFGQEEGAHYFPGPDFWGAGSTSGITMPPVHGFVLWRLYELAEDKARAKTFLREMFPKVRKLHQYLYQYRDPLEEGLVYVHHPWEPGTDNSPTWDPVLEGMQIDKNLLPPYQRKDLQNPKAAAHRPTDADYDRYVYLVDLFRKNDYLDHDIFEVCPFLVQDPLFNAILCWSNEALIKIGHLLGEGVSDFVRWNEWTIYQMNHKLWDEELGTYHAYDLRGDRILPCRTSSGLMPLMGLVPSQDQAEKMLLRLEGPDFTSPDTYLCPTYSLQSPDIDYQKYWRGPVWINMNWMLYQGLLRYDFSDAAEKVRNDSLELLERFGFYEYFDPRRKAGEETGYGTDRFSWSAALCIDFLSNTN